MTEAPTRHLGDVASFVRGITFKPDDVVPVGSPDSVACMRTKNVQSELDLSDVWGIPESFVKRADQYLLTGDLLVSSANSWNLVGKCCRVPLLQWPATLGGFISVLRGDPSQIEARYLHHWFSSPRIQATVRSFGQQTTNISNLNVDRCLRLWLPLPPLAEQKRIAGILDAADALRAKRRQALGQLDTLRQSTFLDMFGDPVTNPLGWEVTTVEGIGSVQGGLQVTSKRRRLPIERPYLRVANVFRGFLELDELKTIRLTEAEELRTSLEYEDILIVEGHGNKEEIGRCARWDGSIVPCVHQNHLIRLRCDRSKASPLYVENYINSPGGRRSLTGTSRTTSGLNTISVSKVRRSQIQLPPLDLQHRFAAVVESIEQQKASQRAHLAELDTLFACLQSRAFRGDL